MKLTFLTAASLLLSTQLVFAECDMRSASTLENERQVSEVIDLVKTKSYGKCEVEFKLQVDGTLHTLKKVYTGWEQEESLCYYAVQEARRDLLLRLGGKFKTEAVTVCKEGNKPIPKIKIGDTILENEVGKSKVDLYFDWRNTKCRLFAERFAERGELNVYHGVICQVDNSGANWLVVDKW